MAATSAARALASLIGEAFRLALAALRGLVLGFLPLEPERALDLLRLREFEVAAWRGGWGGVGPLPVPSGEWPPPSP